MTRWKAAAIHMTIGLVLIGTLIALITHFWFPHALYRIAGMDRLVITMLGVDLVAGPLLTLIVYKAGKRSLKFDLAVIAVLQLAFLGYALHTAWITRPVFLVWAVDKMSLVFANEIDADDLARGTTPRTRSLSWTGPRLYAVVLPKDAKAREKVIIEMIHSGTSVDRLPAFYQPYADAREGIRFWSRPIPKTSANDAAEAALQAAIASTGFATADLRVVAIESSRDASMLLLDAKTMAPLQVVSP
ncbi:MAG: hypothetical protein ACOH1R_12730 [Luteimonas sp.]